MLHSVAHPFLIFPEYPYPLEQEPINLIGSCLEIYLKRKLPLQGMKYLHNSPVKFHGNLTSRHCMIDNHWVVSITDWGLNKFKAGQERIYTDTNKTNEGMYVTDYSL